MKFSILSCVKIHLDLFFCELIFLLDSWTILFKSDPTMVSLSFSLSYPEQWGMFYGMLYSWKALACPGNSFEVRPTNFY